MGIFKNTSKEIIDSANGVIDNLITNTEERSILKIKMSELINQHLTKRHELDMKSDSWLSKNIRPITLIFILLMLVAVLIISAKGGKVDESFTTILKEWGKLAFMFYFGSRGIEKVAKIGGGLFNRKQ
jgi:hypothetical protein